MPDHYPARIDCWSVVVGDVEIAAAVVTVAATVAAAAAAAAAVAATD